jgi:hypothetical protein
MGWEELKRGRPTWYASKLQAMGPVCVQGPAHVRRAVCVPLLGAVRAGPIGCPNCPDGERLIMLADSTCREG